MTIQNSVTINVDIYRHAAVYKENGKMVKTVDYDMYQLSARKDISIKRMERVMKMCAVDCHVHKNRNMFRSSDVPGSRQCDYQENCNYKCMGGVPDYVDPRAFNTVYYKSDSEKIKSMVTEYMSYNMIAEQKDLFQDLDISPSMEIATYSAISELIYSRERILDRFGDVSFLASTGGVLFLHKDPTNIKPDFLDIEYIQTYTSGTEVENYKSIFVEMDARERSYIKSFASSVSEGNYEEAAKYLLLMDEGLKVELLENSIEMRHSKCKMSSQAVFVYKYFENFVYEKLKGVSVTIENKEPIRSFTGDLVTIHTLLTADANPYNAVIKAIDPSVGKFPRDLRLYNLRTKTWSNVVYGKDSEYIVYSAMIRSININKIRSISQITGGIFASITADGNFRLSEEGFVVGSSTGDDRRTIAKGRMCSTMSKSRLINIMYRIVMSRRKSKGKADTIGAKTVKDRIIEKATMPKLPKEKDKSKLSRMLKPYKLPDGKGLKANDPVYKFRFFAAWIKTGVPDMCMVIQEDFTVNGYIFDMSV